MPQINRIRVNNVKYNFGTQFYDDFMMSFSCKNTIYDLANGGGKSVLLLLLLQNLIPNCTLDDKQPVEKLFRTQGGSNVIHSLVEWKLDSCYQKDGYQYMTTGFCARKAKDSGEEGSSGAAGIEYFNYCIFYKSFGDNDIRNLPLSADGERITFNGLKNYLRCLEKNDLSVSVYIFERKGDYQNFIAGYGLFESHWEIIRGINKTEGHVRTYFESNYRTARKVVEDLLIEEIIQKSYHSRIGVSGQQDDMAETLVDIKDKLAELARKKEQISCYDRQIAAMNGFGERIQGFREMMEEKAALMGELSDYLLKCRRLIADTAAALDGQRQEIEAMEGAVLDEQRKIAAAKIMDEQRELDELKCAAAECQKNLDALYAKEKEKRSELQRAEAAADYSDYLEYRTKRDGVLVTIENSVRDKKEVADELYALAARKKQIQEACMDELGTKCAQAEQLKKAAKEAAAAAAEQHRDADIAAAVADSNAAACEGRLEETQKQLAECLNDCGIMVSQEIFERISDEQETLAAVEEKKAADQKKLAEAQHSRDEQKEKLAGGQSMLCRVQEELEACKQQREEYETTAERLRVLSGVYKETDGEKLVQAAYRVYQNHLKQEADAKRAISQTEEYVKKLREGKLVFEGRQYHEVEAYLTETYGADVVYGREWYQSLSSQIRRDIIKRVPFVEYSFVIRGDFERIRKDERLKTFLNCSYVVPVISENIVYSTKLGVDYENIAFGMQDFSFLKEEGKLAEVISRTEEELENYREQYEKIKGHLDIIEEDYTYIVRYAVKNPKLLADIEGKLDALEENGRKAEQQLQECRENIAREEERIANLNRDISSADQTFRQINIRLSALHRAADKQREEQTLRTDITALKEEALRCHTQLKEKEAAAVQTEASCQAAQKEYNRLHAQYEERRTFWMENYASYDKNGIAPAAGEMTEEELDARFLGLRSVVESALVDVNDKKLLVENYEASMDKCKKSIEYRGFDFHEIAQAYESGSIFAADRKRLAALKEALLQADEDCDKVSCEYNSRNAQLNRIEGSISYALTQYEENFGEYQKFECGDIRTFLSEHEAGLKEMRKKIKTLEQESRSTTEALNGYRLLERDIVRITADAGIVMPQELMYEKTVMPEDIRGYEMAEKRFRTLVKNEYRKKEEFLKERQKLSDTLNTLNAQDLASEVLTSMHAPQEAEDVRSMLAAIAEINRCIALERDNVTAGIEDMEKIKDSFENRCIQTCVNIRSELDRLPQLSRITMEDEVISIIGLVIPYVKEEFYKERMSSYINDTIAFAETFRNPDEKMKYIRGRLAWKKLFSVIVTDMNQIRINLYKRERIRSQSRYLRYEEAVGSTGQSQGIYIQFLIAIINYIASINAAGKEVSVMGKTIFIDNPFGAAKDVYIWEPIFKMLKTNHVQLIVPARGATPAITGRFDVNYILGQKMVGSLQQTVVVDYMSEVKSEGMEYTKLSYEQGTLFDMMSD
jgi:hypothetical protein